jgi:outer membrane protein assembly factor BamA
VRYNYIQAEALLRKRIFSPVGIGAGPKFYHYWSRPDDNENKILAHPTLVGLDSARVYSTKTYLGAKAFITINTLNDDLLPTRGVYWNTEFNALYGAGNRSKNFSSLTTDLTLYSSLSDPAKVVSVIKVGGGRIYSKDFEYFQL